MEKTNLEKAQYAIHQSSIATAYTVGAKENRDDAIAYALIAIAETLAQINEKMAAVEHVVYTPGDEG